MTEPRSKGPDFLAVIVLLAIAVTIGLGIWLFPTLQKIIQRQDCIAVGRNDCD